MKLRAFLLSVCVMASVSSAFGQDDAVRAQELARQMHELRPARAQVEQAITIVAAQRVPDDKRAAFESALKNALDFKAIEKISIDTMAETFTADELAAMVEYYSRPEAQSAADKLPKFQQKVGPEIMRMIDRAMMQVKTGQ